MKHIYLCLNIFTIFFPLVLSINKRVHFYTNWRFLFPAMAATALSFIFCNITFTHGGVLGINPAYLVGFFIRNLPLEEVLFFIAVPYACLFIYERLNTYIKREWLQTYVSSLTWFLVVATLAIGLFYWRWWDTMLTARPLIWDNSAHNVGLRIGTFPTEDTMYSSLLVLLTIMMYEVLKQKAESPANKVTTTLVN